MFIWLHRSLTSYQMGFVGRAFSSFRSTFGSDAECTSLSLCARCLLRLGLSVFRVTPVVL